MKLLLSSASGCKTVDVRLTPSQSIDAIVKSKRKRKLKVTTQPKINHISLSVF